MSGSSTSSTRETTADADGIGMIELRREAKALHGDQVDDDRLDSPSGSSEEVEDPDGDPASEEEDDDLDDASTGSVEVFDDVPSLCLSFNDLSYSVRVKKGPFSDGVRGLGRKLRTCKLWTRETKTILKPMSGHFLPGRLVAIMGPSGNATPLGWGNGRWQEV